MMYRSEYCTKNNFKKTMRKELIKPEARTKSIVFTVWMKVQLLFDMAYT